MRRSRERGSTLVEVMIGMAILSIGLLGSARLLGEGIIRTAEAKRVSGALYLGTQIVEKLRLEIRFDIEPSALNGTGKSGAEAFSLENAWKAERLPYASGDEVKGSGSGLGSCQPAGTADGIDYTVGPIAMPLDGNRFWACYRIVPPGPNCLPDSSCADVKIIYRTARGYGARHVNGVLAGGR